MLVNWSRSNTIPLFFAIFLTRFAYKELKLIRLIKRFHSTTRLFICAWRDDPWHLESPKIFYSFPFISIGLIFGAHTL